MRNCLSKCLEDLESTTEFVSWSLHTNGRPGLRSIIASMPQEQAPSPPTAAPSSSTALVGRGHAGQLMRTPTPAMSASMEAEMPTGPQVRETRKWIALASPVRARRRVGLGSARCAGHGDGGGERRRGCDPRERVGGSERAVGRLTKTNFPQCCKVIGCKNDAMRRSGRNCKSRAGPVGGTARCLPEMLFP